MQSEVLCGDGIARQSRERSRQRSIGLRRRAVAKPWYALNRVGDVMERLCLTEPGQ